MAQTTQSNTPERIPGPPGNRPGWKDLLGRLEPSGRRWLAVFVVLLLALFGLPLLKLFQFASARSELYSHIYLIPFISVYLAGLRLRELPADVGTSRGVAGLLLGAGLTAFAWSQVLARNLHSSLPPPEALAMLVLGLLLVLAGGIGWFFGGAFLKTLAGPLLFLVFMAPFPAAVENAIETFFQRTSATAAHVLMNLAGLAVVREGMFFRLPGIVLEVAEECSGIRSSYMLFITSIAAGAVLLRRPSARVALVLAVIPLGILRNGLRILTIAWLCVKVDPSMIDSPIHHRGGPIFFGLSLIPFFAFLLLLRRWEKRTARPPGRS